MAAVPTDQNIHTVHGRQSGMRRVDKRTLRQCAVGEIRFIRGDPNVDGKTDIADAVFLLTYLFREGARPSCMESANANDDLMIDIADTIYLLNFLFKAGVPPRAPFPACGPDPSPGDSLGCESYPPEYCTP